MDAWIIAVPRDDCNGMAKATTWFVRTDAGDPRVSFTLGPVQLSGTDGKCGCGDGTQTCTGSFTATRE